MNIKYYLRKIKDVSLKDYLSFFPMAAGFIGSIFIKKKYEDTWAVCERKDEARDNGYHFYKYMKENHPEQFCIYAIDKHCNDYEKVKAYKDIVQFGSVQHWIIYFSAKWLISSQSFKPNGYMGTLIERLHLFKPDHVFLQHGITKDKAEFLLASHRRAKYFIAGAKPEAEFMAANFGYPSGTIQYTGFSRFDALHAFKTKKNRILVMPTWRKWLRLKSETHEDAAIDIDSSQYISCWRSLLDNERLDALIDQYSLELIFFPHPNMTGILNPSSFVSSKIRIANPAKEDLQELLKTSEMIITDYSSVFFDMIYMKKPVIFYQFDEEKYRKYHYQKGWFDYHQTPFGNVHMDADTVIDELNNIVEKCYQVSEAYLDEHKKVFPLFDESNCERIYQLLSGSGE